MTKKKFGKGVTAAGDAAWQKGAQEKGTSRWGAGVALSQDKYRQNFAPYRDAIERVQLPPRGPKRDPRNLKRVEAVNAALIAVKEQQSK